MGDNRIRMIHRQLYAPRYALGLIAIISFAFGHPTAAQQQPAPASQETPGQKPGANSSATQSSQAGAPTDDQKKEEKQEETTGTSNDRLFWTMPNFLTVKGAEIPPLTAGQKFNVVTRSAFDYFEYPWYGMLAGISQAENDEAGYGQGAEGYAKRYGAAFADGTIENYMVGAVFPSALHQDPRFYELGKGGFWHRTLYAVSRVLITRSDSGHSQFNYSEIFGSATSASISTFSYHPRGERNIGNAATVWGTEVGYDALTFDVKEFWPDIHRAFTHKKAGTATPASSP